MVLGSRANNLRDVRVEVAELIQDLVVMGTATSATSTTLVDTNRLLFANDDSLNGMWVYIHTGTGIGQERRISDFTASSDTIAVLPAWSTTPDSTSQYIVTRRFSASEIDRAIDAGISRYARQCSVPWESHYLGVNNIFNDPDNIGQVTSQGLIYNWQFDEFDTANVPNDWTLTNSNSDEEDTAQAFAGLRRVLKLQNTGSSAGSATLAVENYLKWAGKQVRLWAVMNSTTASRLFGRVDDGVNTDDTENHDGDGRWRRKDGGWFTVSDDATQLIGSYQISSGAQITTRCGPLYLEADYNFQEYILPQAFTVVEDIFFELTNFSDFGRYTLKPVDRRYWDILQGPQTNVRSRQDSARGQDAIAFPRLQLRTDLITPPAPARIRIVGRGFPNLIAAPAATVGGPGGTTNYENISPVAAPELIKYAAALHLNERIPSSTRAASSAWLNGEEQRWSRTYTTRLGTGARRVRDF